MKYLWYESFILKFAPSTSDLFKFIQSKRSHLCINNFLHSYDLHIFLFFNMNIIHLFLVHRNKKHEPASYHFSIIYIICDLIVNSIRIYMLWIYFLFCKVTMNWTFYPITLRKYYFCEYVVICRCSLHENNVRIYRIRIEFYWIIFC